MIATITLGTISAQGDLVRHLPDGRAVVRIGGREVAGTLVEAWRAAE